MTLNANGCWAHLLTDSLMIGKYSYWLFLMFIGHLSENTKNWKLLFHLRRHFYPWWVGKVISVYLCVSGVCIILDGGWSFWPHIKTRPCGVLKKALLSGHYVQGNNHHTGCLPAFLSVCLHVCLSVCFFFLSLCRYVGLSVCPSFRRDGETETSTFKIPLKFLEQTREGWKFVTRSRTSPKLFWIRPTLKVCLSVCLSFAVVWIIASFLI